MARRAFLHVGTAKSGTSYLQDLWWQHRDALRAQGLLLPGSGRRDHFTAAAVVKGMTAVLETLTAREQQAWRALQFMHMRLNALPPVPRDRAAW